MMSPATLEGIAVIAVVSTDPCRTRFPLTMCCVLRRSVHRRVRNLALQREPMPAKVTGPRGSKLRALPSRYKAGSAGSKTKLNTLVKLVSSGLIVK